MVNNSVKAVALMADAVLFVDFSLKPGQKPSAPVKLQAQSTSFLKAGCAHDLFEAWHAAKPI